VLRIPFPGGIPPLLFIFAGLTGFALFRDIVTRSSSSLVSNRQLVSKIYFPRVLLPASAVLNSLVDFAVGLMVFLTIWLVLGLTVAGSEGVNVPMPGWNLLLWPLCVIVLIMISLGVGMIATAMAVSWRDVGHVVPVILMIALYASPVMYDIGFLFESPAPVAQTAADAEIARSGMPAWQRGLYFSNPLAGLLAMYRYSLIGSGAVSWLAFAYSAVFGVVLMLVGAVIFKRMERRFADVI
jgi:lipopolysaccharide transport system permease protein